jgi:ATP-dependent Lhr-like helicase
VFAGAIDDGLGQRILDHLVSEQLLFDDGHGILSMGPGGEQSYGRRHFLDLTSAFTSNPLFVIRHGSKEIGYLDPIALLTQDRSFASVMLAGRNWQVTSIDWNRRFAWVEPVDGGGKSRWLGEGQPLSAPLCDAVRNVLAGDDPPGVTLTARASTQLDELRSTFRWVRRGRTAVVTTETGLAWWTCAGLHANAGLMAGMGPLLGGTKVDNLAIKLDPAVASPEKVREFTEMLDVDALPRPWIAETIAEKLKFADALPADIAVDIAAARTADPTGIARVATEPVDGAYET